MRWLSRYWGLMGVTAFLLSAVIRVMPSWGEISTAGGPLAYGLLAILLPLMVYFEAYRGFYAVEDRTPRVYPWMNEPVGGMLGVWKYAYLHIAPIVFSIT